MAGVKRPAIVDPRNKRQSAETRRVETATEDGDNDCEEEPVEKKQRSSSDHIYCSCPDDRAVKSWSCSITRLLVSIHFDQIELIDISV